MQDLKAAFDLLGIDPSTDDKIVRSAWRALVRSYHPDMAKSDPEAASRKLADINAAFDAVSLCTPAEVKRLQDAEARARRVERQRAYEKHMHFVNAKRAAEAARRARVASETMAEGQSKQTPKSTAVATTEPGHDGHVSSQQRHGPHPKSYWHVSDIAAKAFEAARVICAPHRPPEPRSIYL